jgi:two-component system CheB/CheR fusion protein
VAGESDFDVVVSDISMPEMDGFEFLRRLRGIQRHASVPVLAVTGFGRDEDVQRAKEGGFFAHISKPVDLEQLLGILSDLSAQTRGARVGA